MMENSGAVAEETAVSSAPQDSVVEGVADTQADHLKTISLSESIEKNKKDISEAKRKNPKRTFKSEEFLELILKYQQVLAERDSAITVRDKLESLCRELQRQNKILMDECKRVSTEGQSLRLDLSTKFQDAIKEVSNKLEEQKDECLTQLKENEMLKIKLKHLADQYALTEQQFTQKLKQKSLELQIADIKIQQNEEKLAHEQSQIKLYAEQVSQLLATEKNLRLQLTADGEKFQQFQSLGVNSVTTHGHSIIGSQYASETMSDGDNLDLLSNSSPKSVVEALLKSNEVFETFKQEIEKMAKSIKEFKKENTFLKSKCEKSDVTLIELVEEREHLKKQLEKTKNGKEKREHLKKQLEKTKNEKEKLESLCRSLQADNRSLQAERKQTSIVQNSSDSDSVPV